MTVSDRLRAAYAAYAKGDFAAARAQGEAALIAQPANPTVLQLLGVVSCQTGALKQGADYLRRAIASGGDTSDNRINLARALFDLGELDEAARICAEGDVAESSELQAMQAQILKAQGRTTEASWTYEKLVTENPEDFGAWNNLGNARHERGDLEGALNAFQHARQIDPKSSLIHTNLGRVLTSMDRYEDACLMLEKAALLAPGKAEPLLELGRALTSIGHSESALRALGAAARLNSSDPKIFLAIAVAFMDASNNEQAEKALRFAIKADRSFAAAYLNLGIILEKANRVEDLRALHKSAESAGIAGDELDYLHALLLARDGDRAGALELIRDIRSPAISASIKAQFAGQLADRLGRIDEALYFYEEMNRAQAQSPMGVGVDRSAYQRAIARLEEQTSAVWFADWSVAPAPAARAAPAFLVGFPRSGTTLLDTILMGHSGTHVLEELPIIERLSQSLGDLDAIRTLDTAGVAHLRDRYFAELDKLSPPPPGKLVIDKNPLSMIRIPLIHRLFPDAKIILAMRHPCDVVLSCYIQNFKPTESMASFLDLPNGSRTYDRIFRYWEKCREVFPLDVHMLRYEEMIADVGAATRPLFDFLGLDWEESALDHQKTAVERGYIRTPSYAQVTEPIYSSASGRWKRYEPQMREILPILQPWVERYGYSLD
ncbi:tetratricopeptide repeat-containing sulfotransferase family protein [Sphingopyxis kveilinensis]|uniref:tetratricopeptide repeat-containing sulfotransferase family protein n=1 Tax=Sphingopyxis kveilinensis TaxID=3114367 RepID=UPI0030D5679F